MNEAYVGLINEAYVGLIALGIFFILISIVTYIIYKKHKNHSINEQIIESLPNLIGFATLFGVLIYFSVLGVLIHLPAMTPNISSLVSLTLMFVAQEVYHNHLRNHLNIFHFVDVTSEMDDLL